MLPEERFERIERQLEFLASHQAESALQIERHSAQIGQLGEFLLRTARLLEDLARRTDERIHDLGERLLELAKAQQRTDERLNILIGVVERYFSNGKQDR